MTAIDYVLGGILLAAALFLVIAVLMQSGKEKSLSGTIAGAGESFFSKNKGKTKERALSVVTSILSIIFVILAVVFVIVIAIHEPSTTTESASFFMGK